MSLRFVLVLRACFFLLFLSPISLLAFQAVTQGLGPDPAEKLADETGQWALRLLLLTIAITPLRKLTGAVFLVRLRRMTGLFAFSYGLIHLLVFVAFFIYWDFAAIMQELLQRPYITVGFASLLLLIPLAFTSTNSWQRRLGRRWVSLHKLVYPATVLALVHLYWQVRSDWFEAGIYALVFVLLLLLRFAKAGYGFNALRK